MEEVILNRENSVQLYLLINKLMPKEYILTDKERKAVTELVEKTL